MKRLRRCSSTLTEHTKLLKTLQEEFKRLKIPHQVHNFKIHVEGLEVPCELDCLACELKINDQVKTLTTMTPDPHLMAKQLTQALLDSLRSYVKLGVRRDLRTSFVRDLRTTRLTLGAITKDLRDSHHFVSLRINFSPLDLRETVQVVDRRGLSNFISIVSKKLRRWLTGE